ncbi:MAG: hypothetical protein IID58_02610 [Proteobacteria bacterium]|nr:hypothetical protein [Pseudomonadota bacterium]
MTNEEKDEEMICGMTAGEHDTLRRGLNELVDTMPPRIVWRRIRDQAEAEGLLRRPASQRPSTWYGGIGLAAAVVLAVIVVPKIMNTSEPEFPTEPPLTALTNQVVEVTALQALMVQSQQLESDLRALPEEPRVQRASMIATIADIEDRVAAIDYQLNDPSFEMKPEEREIFWRERVRLMKSLLRLRYAQAQRSAF